MRVCTVCSLTPMFQRTLLPPYPVYEGRKVLQNVGILLQQNEVSQPRRPQFESSLL
jgi:hypothetical protein